MTHLRLIKEEEIEFIIDFIRPQVGIPLDSAMAIVENNKERFRKQLRGQSIYSEIIPQLKQDIEKTYFNSLVQAGESVGIICAQSIGEKQTQTCLNTFHSAGISNKTMTTGVPRFQELINATKNPRMVNHKIYFNEGRDSIENLRDVVGHTITGLRLIDITTSITVGYNKEPEDWYDIYKVFYNDDFTRFPHCIIVKFNMNKLFENKLTLEKITNVISNEFADLHCVFSPCQVGEIHIFVDTTDITLPEDRIMFINPENEVEIYLEECVITTISEIHICGVLGIEEIFYSQDEKTKEWLVETNAIPGKGTNKINAYKKLLSLDNIDSTRTLSNNIWDIYEVLGIEAVKEFLIEELSTIMEGINTCHNKLLVDRMLHGGSIASITRYTLKKDECGPMGKASFEESLDNFLNAGASGTIEPTEGVSSAIICGKRANIGTGMIELKADFNKLLQMRKEM
jgi:DNA-directed RNA polymerase II subunit RPB1